MNFIELVFFGSCFILRQIFFVCLHMDVKNSWTCNAIVLGASYALCLLLSFSLLYLFFYQSISGKCRSLYYQGRVVFYSGSFTHFICQSFQTNMAAMTELEEFVDIDHDTEFLPADVADILEHAEEGIEVIVEEDEEPKMI